MTAQVSALQQQAAQELLRRRNALESLAEFRRYLSPVARDFEHPPARHHEVMIHALQRLSRGEINRLLILAPPGSAKSTYCSIQFPLFHLARNPSARILCSANTESLAETFNRRRRNVCLTPEWMRLSGTKLADDQQGAIKFATEREGFVMAAGVGSAIVGHRSDMNVLDDPITGFEEAQSATQLEKAWDWFLSDFRSRLVPGGKELVVTTRWAKRDPAGRIIELARRGEEDWTIIRLPMLADSPDDPLGREIGEPLWPEYFSYQQHVVEPQRDVRRWSGMYQQVPLDESGAWIDQECIQYEHATPGNLRFVIAVDLALSVGKGDWTIILVAGIDHKRNVHVVDVFRDRVSVEKTLETLFELNAGYQPSEILLDDDNASKVFMRMITVLGRERNEALPFNLLPLRGRDKETRAAPLRGWFQQKRIFIKRAPWNADLHRELLEFPSGDHDDHIDALSLIGRRLGSLSAGDVPQGKSVRFKGIYTDGRIVDGKLMSNATLDELWETLPKKNTGRIARI